MRTKILGLLIGGVLFAHGLAWGVPVPCNTITTAGGFEAATDGCTIGDKLFTSEALESTVPDAVGLEISNTPLLTGDIFTLTLTFSPGAGGNGVGPQAYVFDYDVTIVGSLFTFLSVSLDSDTGGTLPVSVVKLDEDGGKFATLTSLNGAPGGTSLIPAGTTNLSVEDTITIGAGGVLFSTSETFKQRESVLTGVPEPSTFFLVGFGLVGLGVLRRRRLR